MSITNSITKLLNLKEDNLIFSENFLEEIKIKDKRCLVIKGYLFNKFDYCPKCGCINENTIIKKETKSSLIKITKLSERDSYLELDKQTYMCKNCNKKIIAFSNIIDYRCHISNNVKLSVFNYAKEPISKILIAKLYNISDDIVQRIFDKQFNHDTFYKDFLPI